MVQQHYGTGKRKSAIARVWLRLGKGRIMINKVPIDKYFPRDTLKTFIKQPLKLTKNLNTFDIYANVYGGGKSGQASALRHGIARALLSYDVELRTVLKKAGLLTRDARVKERKKYGQRGARARFQFSKR